MRETVIFRLDADQKIGMGHASRCISLADAFQRRSVSSCFAAKYLHPNALKTLLRDRVMIRIPRNIDWQEESTFLWEATTGLDVRCLIFDVSTPYALEHIAGVEAFLKEARRHCPICVLDSMGVQSLSNRLNICCDLVVVPYVGLEEPGRFETDGSRYLVGPEYFIFGADYIRAGSTPREFHETKASNVLISFGGSDIRDLTPVALRALDQITDRDLHVRVVAGQGFGVDAVRNLQREVLVARHTCEIIVSPDSLYEHMAWCDIALTNTGLTKYELAVTGTPSLQISIDDAHDEINRPYVDKGAAEYLGVYSGVDDSVIRDSLLELLDNTCKRRRMSREGCSLVDGLGTDRVIDEILALDVAV